MTYALSVTYNGGRLYLPGLTRTEAERAAAEWRAKGPEFHVSILPILADLED